MSSTAALPDRVRQVLEGVVESAKHAFGDALRSIVLFGSAAEGQMRATSDVNLMFVLRSFDETSANDFREPFRFSDAAIRANAMFILEEELPQAAVDFAQKFADMKRRHVVLFGDDPLPALEVSRAALVRRVRQVLLNLTLRLRDMYVTRSLREEQCAITLAEAAAPLRTAAAAILELEGRGAMAPKAALQQIVEESGDARFAELLPHFSEARETRALPAGRAAALLFIALDLARALHLRALAL